MRLETELFAGCALAFFAFALLGLWVVRRAAGGLDAIGLQMRGGAVLVARAFTISGRSIGVTCACIVAVLVFLLLRLPLWIPAGMILSQIVSQAVVETAKVLYARKRPDYWLLGLDAGHSYPSGHAATAVIFFLGWAVAAIFSGMAAAPRDAIAALLLMWALGIAWSRLALGAHYLSDVVGGLLFGCGWLCGVLAVLLHFAILRA